MSSSDRTLTGYCWAQVVPTYSPWWNEPRGVKIKRITQRKPKNPEPGCLLIQIRLAVPASVFVPAEFEIPLEIEPGDGDLVPVVTPLRAVPDGG